ncbi:unnamed protein product [Owenia fusiformis]|uniref:Mitochondrial import inner membrane translocase subunit n=1 Tax=Owenia fusiformis TaxID=6347 RepID=A0A8J1TF65_OWEFU|nr:unnamed protein product [Owenia fusiformis]
MNPMQMDDAAHIRNMRDFLTVYNRMTENCFTKCVYDMNHRFLATDEAGCVERCSSKHVNTNHKIMSEFVIYQQKKNEASVAEAEKQQQKIEQELAQQKAMETQSANMDALSSESTNTAERTSETNSNATSSNS